MDEAGGEVEGAASVLPRVVVTIDPLTEAMTGNAVGPIFPVEVSKTILAPGSGSDTGEGEFGLGGSAGPDGDSGE